MTTTRVPDDVLQDIGARMLAAATQLQDRVGEVEETAGAGGRRADELAEQLEAAQASVADRLGQVEAAVASWQAPAGGGGGYGPGSVAPAGALPSVKAAARASGGAVSDGTNDYQLLQDTINRYGQLIMLESPEGDPGFRLARTVQPPARRAIRGQGPASKVTGLAGLSGAVFESLHDHNWYSDFTISGGAEAAGTHHIKTTLTDAAGYTTGQDGCTLIERLISRNAKGRPVIVEGFNNRDAKVRDLHCWNAANGILFNSPDGRAHDVIAGTCGGTAGIELGTSSANWHVSGKSWYSEGDGVREAGSRHTLNDIEGQDSRRAGIRLLGYETQLSAWLADSNSWWSGSSVTGVNSGLEIGCNPASMSGTTWSPGSATGGFDISVGLGKSWDKNEGKRGVNQRFGVLVRGGVRGLIMVGVSTGAPGGHQNLTDGIKFLTASDLSHETNAVAACLSHRVRVQS